MGLTIGIDLGTTNSLVAIKRVSVITIRNSEGAQITPSCLTCLKSDPDPNFIVGRSSLNLYKQYPEQTVKSIKRLIGRDFKDPEVQYMIKNHVVTYKIVSDLNEPNTIKISLLDRLYSPEDLTVIILKKLIEDAKLDLKDEIEQAVVTVPAYFSDRQKFATRFSCEQAGFKLLRLLSEPTAAALSFGIENLSSCDLTTIMVFDLGGGTFDISVLNLAGGSFMEITKGGDMWLGGDNIDQMLVDYFLKEVEKTLNGVFIRDLINNLSLVDRNCFLVELKEKAEAAKIALGTQDNVNIEMFGILKDQNGKFINLNVNISKEQFNLIIKPVIKKISTIAKQILQEIHFEPELIDTVLMVGGSSLIIAFQDELKRIFGANKVMVHPRPMFAIAEGAAIMAAQLSQKDLTSSDFSMTHIAAHDYYLQLAEGKRHLLVARNTPLPVTVHEKLKFLNSQQILARLRVFNSIDDILEPVGEIWVHKRFKELDVYDQSNKEQLNLEFTVDQDNIITMKVKGNQDQQLIFESQIARGGVTNNLYNDLEKTLSETITKSKNISMEIDLLLLSNTVVATILDVCDPLTGKLDLAKKEKAKRQINLLRLLHKNNIPPLNLYKFGGFFLEIGIKYKILSSQEQLILQDLLTELKTTLEQLEDFDKFTDLNIKIHEFTERFLVINDLIIAEKGAKVINQEEPSKAKEILNSAKKLAKYYIEKDHNLFELTKVQIYDEVDARVIWNTNPTKRFDRDVTL